MDSVRISMRWRRDGVSRAVDIPHPTAVQDLRPRYDYETWDEMVEGARRDQSKFSLWVAHRNASMAYNHLPSELSYLATQQPGLSPLQCRACGKVQSSLMNLVRHTGNIEEVRCPVIRIMLAYIRAEEENDDNNDLPSRAAAAA